MKKKFLLLAGILVLSAASAAGCNGSSNASEDKSAEENKSESGKAPAETESTGAVSAGSREGMDQDGAPAAYAKVIKGLDDHMYYAFADIDGKNGALLVTDTVIDGGNENMVAASAILYGYDSDGEIKDYGNIESSSDAYPFVVNGGFIYYGGDHGMNKAYLDESSSRLVISAESSESLDEQGNTTYYYKEDGSSPEEIESDDTKLQQLYKEYTEGTEIVFTRSGK